jgi:hypothetical protein
MQRATNMLWERAPELEVEGEMHGDAALSGDVRSQVFPNARLKGEANLLIMPTLDAANIAFNLLKQAAGDGVTIGPILLGTRAPVSILTPTATVRRIVNLTAVTVVEAARGVDRQASRPRGRCRYGRFHESQSRQDGADSHRGRRARRLPGRRAGRRPRAAARPRHNPFPIICGTSAGAINAAALACFAEDFGKGVHYLQDVWRNFHASQVYRADALGIGASGLNWLSAFMFGWLFKHSPRSLLDNTPLRHLLERSLDFSNIDAAIESGALYAFSHHLPRAT